MLNFKLEGRFKDIDFLSGPEQMYFRYLRSIGKVSFFKIAICECEGCNKEIPLTKKYCSFRCKQEMEGKKEEIYYEEEW